MKILLIEDNAELAKWLAMLLEEEGFGVDYANNGETALVRIAQSHYDVVLLDLKLPGMEGRAVLRSMRREGKDVPVLVLTASASIDTKIDSLERGADDYLTKPFDERELVARIKALIRRNTNGNGASIFCANLSFDLNTHVFRVDGADVVLTPRERSVLEALILQRGKTVSKTALARLVFESGSASGEDAIELYVHRLRRKLSASRARIVTLRGVGYLLSEEHVSGR